MDFGRVPLPSASGGPGQGGGGLIVQRGRTHPNMFEA